jgi:hypothetical protein
MAAGLRHEAAVLDRRVLEREPEADAAHGLGMEKAAVLVADHLAADPGLLEDVHGLDQQRLDDPETGGQGREPGSSGEGVEHRIEIVKSMAHLVDRPCFSTVSLPSASNAPASKKKRILSPESRK